MRKLLLSAFFFGIVRFSHAQSCTTLGQLPSSAFPVCGTTVFQQTTVPICSTHALSVPGCSNQGVSYTDKNPFWYKFTCYVSGTLGFLITPKNLGDDYDWQLYDITGHNPNDVFTNTSLIVTGNWAGTYGLTGASNTGVNFIQCASDPASNLNSFSTMPNLLAGHTYLLLVSHFSDSQSGYSLSFGGGTAIIKDPKIPAFLAVDPACGGDILRVKLNKPVKCSSIAADGSDFYILPGSPAILSAVGIGCSTSFDTDSLEIHLSGFLSPGDYTLFAQEGTDNNTLLDDCDNAIPPNSGIGFTVFPKTPTPLDSIVPVKCSPSELHLHFRRPILCSSIAPDGTDFSISGSYPVFITAAIGSCSGGIESSKDITLNLSRPLQTHGTFTITLQQGTDGNTIIDECGTPSVAGSSISFEVKDTVNADFSYNKKYGCTADTIYFTHPGGNQIDSWSWDLDEGNVSVLQNPVGVYYDFTTKTIQLIVSNGFCSDTAHQTITLDNYLKADFVAATDICPNEPVQFTDASQGKIVQYNWTFGDGGQASTASPSHIFSAPFSSLALNIKLTVLDSLGCTSSVVKPSELYSSCVIFLPNAFTPNNDGRNDFFHPLNAIKAEQAEFRVFNRWGQLVFETRDWKHGWDGNFNGQPQPAGVYVWYFQFKDRDTHESRLMKGTTMLIR